MKRITDERLKLKNLQNIRILFIVENIGIIGILGYEWITQGIEAMRSNPLWFVFILTGVVSAYLSMNISVDHESSKKSPKKGLIISLIVSVLISVGLGVIFAITNSINIGLLIGGIFFVCFLAPSLYLYHLRTK